MEALTRNRFQAAAVAAGLTWCSWQLLPDSNRFHRWRLSVSINRVGYFSVHLDPIYIRSPMWVISPLLPFDSINSFHNKKMKTNSLYVSVYVCVCLSVCVRACVCVCVCVLKRSMCVTFTETCVIDSRHEASAMNPVTKPASSLRSTYRSYP